MPLADLVGEKAISATPLATRWKPVDVACSGGVAVRAKFVRDQHSAAMCISEAVSHEVMRLIGLTVAEPHSLLISVPFAADLSRQFGFEPAVIPGRHWATTLMTRDAVEVEIGRDHFAVLERPDDVFKLFVADVLLGNRDRLTHGNVLLRGSRKMALIPIDQSDCFNHPSCLVSQQCLVASYGNSIADRPEGLEELVLQRSANFVADQIAFVQHQRAAILASVNGVPGEWFVRSQVDPQWIRDFLYSRLNNLANLVDIGYWNGLKDAIAGGHVIKLI